MAHGGNILELNTTENTWLPPEIPEGEMAYSVREDENALQSMDFLYIFQTEPYIDSIVLSNQSFLSFRSSLEATRISARFDSFFLRLNWLTHLGTIVFWQSSDGKVYCTQPGRAPVKICDSLVDYINQDA